MITEEERPSTDDPRSDQGDPEVEPAAASRTDLLDESITSSARLAPPRHARHDASPDAVLAGGDASKAPRRLSEGQLEPIEGSSSGVSWDDPDEL